jgi:transcription elongation factor GreA
MSSKDVFLTPEGRRKLEEELEFLCNVKRPEVASRIRAAKAEGDVMENAGYDEAKTQQAFLEGRILTIENMLKNAVMIDEPGPSDSVRVGSRVTIVEEGGEPEMFRIVGSAEADPGNGKISNESPLGKALLNRTVGNVVEVRTPDGVLRVRIEAIN